MTTSLPLFTAFSRAPSRLPLLGAGLALLLAGAAAQARPLGAQGEDFLYRVEPGDTLEALARRYTRDPDNWRALQNVNRIADPHQLPVAKVLRIPLALIPRLPARATVTYIHGSVTRDGKALQVGDTLETGDVLRSGRGSATLSLEDHSLLTIAPDSEVRVRNLQTFDGAGLTDTVLDLPRGSVESSVAPDDTGVGRFEIRTPATVTGVRGTQLRVHTGESGSRHEVLHGEAAIRNPDQAEQRLAQAHGAAYDATGALLGVQTLLPAPTLQPLAPGASLLTWAPVPGAASYRVQVALDDGGTQLESSRLTAQSSAALAMTGTGLRYVFVRAIDALGIEGSDAMLRIRLLPGLASSDGSAVLDGSGAPIRVGGD